MKLVIVIVSIIYLSAINSFEYKEESYDYDDGWERSGYEEDSVPDDIVGPSYDLKDAPKLFQKFVNDYNKSYKDEEEYIKRYENFVRSLEIINKINKQRLSYTADIQPFSDLSSEEMKAMKGGVPADLAYHNAYTKSKETSAIKKGVPNYTE